MKEYLKEFLRSEFDNYTKIADEITEDEFETMLENIASTAEDIIKNQ